MNKNIFIIVAILKIAIFSDSYAVQNTWGLLYWVEYYGQSSDNYPKYKYHFHLSNNGPNADAIFKWSIKNVPDEWDYNYHVPRPEWTANHPGINLNWQTDNGNYGSGNFGAYRLYGKNVPGSKWVGTYTFEWWFTNRGGPIPTNSFFSSSDFNIHFQMINDDGYNSGDSYIGSGGIIPEPTTLLLFGCGIIAIGMIGWCRKRT